MFKRHLIIFLAVSVVLTGIFMLTRPDQLPSAVLVAVFAFLYVQIAVLFTIIMIVVNKLGQFAWRPAMLKRVAYSLAVLPVFLLLLQSIGQLTWRDFLLSAAFAGLGYFYYSRFVSRKREQST